MSLSYGLIQPSGVEPRRQPMILLVGHTLSTVRVEICNLKEIFYERSCIFEDPIADALNKGRLKEYATERQAF